MLTEKKIAFIGCGTMGEAMLKGLHRNNLIESPEVTASDPYEKKLNLLRDKYQVMTTSCNSDAVIDRDIVILATKPQVLPAVFDELTGLIPKKALVISIAAGVTVASLADGLYHQSIVRVMPNTPGQVGEGISVWFATDEVSEEQIEMARIILGALGEELQVGNEDYLDMATALSGTGPAYVLLFMEAMIDAGVHMGFSRRISEKLVMQTMKGTIEYAAQSGKHPAVLRNEVTSPAGTTAAALYQMDKGQLRTVVSRAIWAAYERSIELGGKKAKKSRS